jgi:hypothetical protein
MDAGLAKADEPGGSKVFGPDEVPGIGLVLGQFAGP